MCSVKNKNKLTVNKKSFQRFSTKCTPNLQENKNVNDVCVEFE